MLHLLVMIIQVNSVSVTSSNFPNRETFVHREDFCILVEKLIKTCQRNKYFVLHQYYPEMCNYIWDVKTNTSLEPMCKNNKWSPAKMGFTQFDPR